MSDKLVEYLRSEAARYAADAADLDNQIFRGEELDELAPPLTQKLTKLFQSTSQLLAEWADNIDPVTAKQIIDDMRKTMDDLLSEFGQELPETNVEYEAGPGDIETVGPRNVGHDVHPAYIRLHKDEFS